ncbi:MAG: hypothetical protein AAFO86_10910 [Pseudomonadota bacterium]
MSTNTNAATAAFATERGTLPLRRLTLIGIAGSETARRALLRTPAGEIVSVSVGDAVRQTTVAAISDNALTLASRNSTATVMHLPARDAISPAA